MQTIESFSGETLRKVTLMEKTENEILKRTLQKTYYANVKRI